MHEEKWKSCIIISIDNLIISFWFSKSKIVASLHQLMSWKVELQMSSQTRSHPILRSACCQSLPDQPVACCHAQWVLLTESATGCSRISSFSTSIIASTTSSFSDIFCLSWPWAFRTLLYWQIKSVPTKMSSLFLLFKSSTWTFPHPSQWCLYQGHG